MAPSAVKRLFSANHPMDWLNEAHVNGSWFAQS